jgi:hypothetical protein
MFKLSQLDSQDFEKTVASFLLRHQSILDLLSKYQETCARTNRAIAKAVTSCGCIKVNAEKQPLPPDASLEDLKKLFSTHMEGELCENCREIITSELGKNLFYITALGSTLGIPLHEILEKEYSKVKTLGKFNMT